MNITKGQTVYCGTSKGVVTRKMGPFAVQVWTAFERPEQDFLSHRVTVIKGFRHETWPLKSISITEPTTA